MRGFLHFASASRYFLHEVVHAGKSKRPFTPSARVTDLSRESHPSTRFSLWVPPPLSQAETGPACILRETAKDFVASASCRHVVSVEFHGRRKFIRSSVSSSRVDQPRWTFAEFLGNFSAFEARGLPSRENSRLGMKRTTVILMSVAVCIGRTKTHVYVSFFFSFILSKVASIVLYGR